MDNSLNGELNFNTGFMREHRKLWSLQHDVDLLNNMESFSQGLIKKTCLILDAMEEFHREISMTSIGVKTLSNTFEGVSNNQFVENRVYDEEEDMVCEDDQGKNDFVSSNLNKRLEESLKLCAKSLENKFEPVSITMNDLEDDVGIFNTGEVILIPKNRYKSRPLPHLVGGKEFISDDSLGLFSLPEGSEEGGENLFIGDADQVDADYHSEASGNDVVDHCFQKNSLLIDNRDEIKRSNTPEKNVGCLTQPKEDMWKEIEYEEEQYINEKCSDIKTEPQPNIHHFNPFDLQSRSPVGQMKAAVTDEIKGLFNQEYDDQTRLPIFIKAQNPVSKETVKNVEDIRQSVVNNIEYGNISEKHVPNLLTKSNENSIFANSSHSEAKLNFLSNKDKSDHISFENGLPNIPTEVLHSFAKNRAKIKGKRRLPTRRPKNIACSTEANISKQEPADNVLSPSTDEEDLFVLPQVHIPKESSHSLFAGPGLFSPGSSIEGDSKPYFDTKTIKREEVIDRRKEEFIEEPLRIEKNNFHSERQNNNLFSDWDPFTSEESFLFSSVDKKSRKMKLFDDINGSTAGKLLKDDEDDDIFLFRSSTSTNSASSLFSPPSSSTTDITSGGLDSYKGSKLFIDNDNSYGKSLFGSSTSDDLLFKSSDNISHRTNLSSKQDSIPETSGSKYLMDKKLDQAPCSNPLMETEDSLFD